MIRTLLPYKSVFLVLAGMVLRDLWCWCAAKVFYWRKRRQSQKHAAQARELPIQRLRNYECNTSRAAAPSAVTAYLFVTPARKIEALILPADRRRFSIERSFEDEGGPSN